MAPLAVLGRQARALQRRLFTPPAPARPSPLTTRSAGDTVQLGFTYSPWQEKGVICGTTKGFSTIQVRHAASASNRARSARRAEQPSLSAAERISQVRVQGRAVHRREHAQHGPAPNSTCCTARSSAAACQPRAVPSPCYITTRALSAGAPPHPGRSHVTGSLQLGPCFCTAATARLRPPRHRLPQQTTGAGRVQANSAAATLQRATPMLSVLLHSSSSS